MENQPPKDTAINILKLIIIALLGFAVLMFVFGLGVFVGEERANFSFSWAEDYHKDFGGPPHGMFGNFPDQDFTSGHGVFGQVIKVDAGDIIVKGQDNVEKTIDISSQTTIRNNTSLIKLSNIKVNDSVVVIGSPDSQGVVQAKFIRVLPAGSVSLMYRRDNAI